MELHRLRPGPPALHRPHREAGECGAAAKGPAFTPGRSVAIVPQTPPCIFPPEFVPFGYVFMLRL